MHRKSSTVLSGYLAILEISFQSFLTFKDDQIRNPNINNKDHLVGRPTNIIDAVTKTQMALLARKGFERVKVKSATSYLMLAVCVYLSCTDCFSVNSCSYLFEEPPFRHQQARVDFNTVNTHQRPSPSPSHLTANESIDISDQRWSSSYFFFLPQPLPTVFSWYWGENLQMKMWSYD